MNGPRAAVKDRGRSTKRLSSRIAGAGAGAEGREPSDRGAELTHKGHERFDEAPERGDQGIGTGDEGRGSARGARESGSQGPATGHCETRIGR